MNRMSPSRLMPNSSRGLMPASDADVMSSAVRLLRQGRTMLPKPRFRFISVPEVGWAKGGELLGTCAARLDAPDNSILILSLVEESGETVMLPPPGSRIEVSNNPDGIAVDDGLIDILQSVLRGTVISPAVFDDIVWPYPLIPLVVEASRTRRRGSPVCTPIVARGSGDEFISSLATTLYGIGTDLRVGIIITRSCLSSSGTAWDIFERIISKLSGSIELIEGSGGTAYGGLARRGG